jgi:UDP-N-acetylmuramoylalanine--D-glutamate ligase
MISRDYFKGKRIAVIGLGPEGNMMSDIKFLIKSGAVVSLYEMRSEARLKAEITLLRSFGLMSYVCGSIPEDDLLDMNLIILSHEYPRNSLFLEKAYKAGITIEYPETLFFKLAPPIMLIGIMGSCGKSTVLSMTEPLLQKVFADEDQKLFIIDPDGADGAISFLKKIKSGDVVLTRINDPLMIELYNMRISPHVAVFTTTPSLNTYKESPFEILTYQTYNNFIVASDDVIDKTHTVHFQPKGKMLRTKQTLLPKDWEFSGRGIHDRENAALAIQVAKLFKLDDELIQNIIEDWKPLKGRLEFVKKVKNIEFFNDTASITPYSTQIGLSALSHNRDVVLIMGGADSGHDLKVFLASLPQYVNTVILVPGSGTLRERSAFRNLENVRVLAASDIESAVSMALDNANKNYKVLFSPGFGAGGFDRSRKERGERFVRAVRLLK